MTEARTSLHIAAVRNSRVHDSSTRQLYTTLDRLQRKPRREVYCIGVLLLATWDDYVVCAHRHGFEGTGDAMTASAPVRAVAFGAIPQLDD